jgi:hypothetical protein
MKVGKYYEISQFDPLVKARNIINDASSKFEVGIGDSI